MERFLINCIENFPKTDFSGREKPAEAKTIFIFFSSIVKREKGRREGSD